jgi:hypothetical protein
MKDVWTFVLGAVLVFAWSAGAARAQQAAHVAGKQLAQQVTSQWVQSPGQSFGAVTGGGAAADAPVATATLTGTAGAGCPVSLRVQHKADGSVIETRDVRAKGHASLGQWLHLTLANPQGKKVTAALIEITGFSGKARRTQTAGSAGDARQTMTVPFTATGQAAEADLWVPEMSAVQAIEIKSVAFDDGAVWTVAAGAGCRVAPDLFMAVAAR